MLRHILIEAVKDVSAFNIALSSKSFRWVPININWAPKYAEILVFTQSFLFNMFIWGTFTCILIMCTKGPISGPRVEVAAVCQPWCLLYYFTMPILFKSPQGLSHCSKFNFTAVSFILKLVAAK